MTRAANALDSLYGKKSALAGNVGAPDREQEVWTPDEILDVAQRTMGDIAFDPCAASCFDSYVDNTVKRKRKGQTITEVIRNEITGGWFADVSITAPGGEAFREHTLPDGRVLTILSDDSLQMDWDASSTFVNPPFDDLEVWLPKAASEARKSRDRKLMFFGPFRTHRKWLPPILQAADDLLTLHYNVKFKGYRSAVPFPLFLATWNCEIPHIGALETARWL